MGVSLVGTVNGVGGSGAITVSPPSAPSPIDLTVQPGSVTGGAPATAILTLNRAAPAGGAVATLSSTHPAIASVPASVTVSAGARTVSFPVTTFASLTTDVDVLCERHHVARRRRWRRDGGARGAGATRLNRRSGSAHTRIHSRRSNAATGSRVQSLNRPRAPTASYCSAALQGGGSLFTSARCGAVGAAAAAACRSKS
jgi:hypothetical protein